MIVWLALLVAILLAGAWAFGPRTPVDTTITFDPSAIGTDPDAYLAKAESAFSDIRPGLNKQIVWAFPQSKAKTPIAIVYIHGFSASLGEVRPVPDKLAASLGANLYFARMTGHGRTSDAMGEITVNGWVNDLAEAIAVGRTIGEKVVVIGTSAGGALVTWGLGQGEIAEQVAAAILISPAYELNDPAAFLLTLPFAQTLAEAAVGPRRSFVPENELHKRFWTYEYPTSSVLVVAELAKLARNAGHGAISVPTLFITATGDKVIRAEAVRDIAGRWGGPHELIVYDTVDDPYAHVLAGDALSPSTTERMTGEMLRFVQANVK